MGTVADKLSVLQSTKEAIRYALIAMGQDVPENAPFSSYSDYILSLPTGGELPEGLSELTMENGMPEMGSVSQGGYVSDGVQVTIEAVPNEGYKFSGWSRYKGSNKFPTMVSEQTHTFIMSGKIRFRAKFEVA